MQGERVKADRVRGAGGLVWAAVFATLLAAAPTRAAEIRACFSPPLPGGCDPLATGRIGRAAGWRSAAKFRAGLPVRERPNIRVKPT